MMISHRIIDMAWGQLHGTPQSGWKVGHGERRKKEKSMASYVCNHHHGWRMQAAWCVCLFLWNKFLMLVKWGTCTIDPIWVALGWKFYTLALDGTKTDWVLNYSTCRSSTVEYLKYFYSNNWFRRILYTDHCNYWLLVQAACMRHPRWCLQCITGHSYYQLTKIGRFIFFLRPAFGHGPLGHP